MRTFSSISPVVKVFSLWSVLPATLMIFMAGSPALRAHCGTFVCETLAPFPYLEIMLVASGAAMLFGAGASMQKRNQDKIDVEVGETYMIFSKAGISLTVKLKDCIVYLDDIEDRKGEEKLTVDDWESLDGIVLRSRFFKKADWEFMKEHIRSRGTLKLRRETAATESISRDNLE